MIKGIYSTFIRQKVIEAQPSTYESLRDAMVRTVVVALECYRNDTGNIGSLDWLAATTIFATNQEDEPMDI